MTDEKSSSLTLDRSEVRHNEAELVTAHGVDAAVHADLDPLPLLLRKEKILTLKRNYLESSLEKILTVELGVGRVHHGHFWAATFDQKF